MLICLRRMPIGKSQGVKLAEEYVYDGESDWMGAIERMYNTAMNYSPSEKRVLVADDYKGGGFQQPFGMHTVTLALYDPAGPRYLYDDPIRAQVTPK